MEKIYTIYALCDPDTTAVRYIGATRISPRTRLSQIKYGYTRGQFKEVGGWVWSLLDAGKSPLIVVLEDRAPDGINGERRWIMAYRAAGAALFNKSAGGQGPTGIPHTDEWKRNAAVLMTGRIVSQETRDKISAANRGNKRPDARARAIASRRFSPEQVLEIKALLAEGKTMKYVATSFGVSPALICLINSGKRYAS